MRLSDILNFGVVYAPWPIEIDKKIIDGHLMRRSPVCIKKCSPTPTCADIATASLENVCPHGLSFFRTKIGGDDITVLGVKGPNNPNISAPHLKDALKGRTVTDDDVKKWVDGLTRFSKGVEEDFLRRQSEMLDPLHDPIRLARQIQSISHNLVQKEIPGRTLDEQVDRASPELKSLVKAADLLSDSFDLLTIYFNPDSASFGRKSYISLHGLLRKIVSILGIYDPSDNDGEPVRIFLNGSCYRQVLVHESFKLVPFALISNAVKYCLEGPIRVELTERQGYVSVAVESMGPLIEQDELLRIFEKRGRGRWAAKVAGGSGVGLYLAKIISEANGFELRASSVRQSGRQLKGVPLAINTFSFEMPVGANVTKS